MAESSRVNAPDSRSERFEKLLHAFLTGLRPVNDSRDVRQLLQALCSIEDRAACIEKLGCSKSGLDVLRRGLRFDITIAFINGPLTDLLTYLTAAEVKRLANGDFLRRILLQIVSPPALWDALVQAHQDGQLSQVATMRFAWLLLELLTWAGDCPIDVSAISHDVSSKRTFIDADDADLRTIGYRIQHIVQVKASGRKENVAGPGGRHDNDFEDFREIAIYPTEDELTSRELPFYQTANALDQVEFEQRAGHHLDNQFRLLREDFLAELRDDLDIAAGKKKPHANRIRTRLQSLRFNKIHGSMGRSRSSATLAITAGRGLGQLTSATDRKAFLRANPNFLKHQSFGYFVDNGKVIAFGSVVRNEELLLHNPPLVTIRTPGNGDLNKVILALTMSTTVEFARIETAVFAYEPVLRRLQSKMELPLAEQLLARHGEETDLAAHYENSDECKISRILEQIAASPEQDLRSILQLSKSVKLDASQSQSLLAGLRQSVSLIQGPPGTGKSFIGALLAKALYGNTSENLLVICYTNHALDQFLEDLLDIGIPSNAMVRLGSKSTARTKHLSLRDQALANLRTQENWSNIKRLHEEVDEQEAALGSSTDALTSLRVSGDALLEHLEFSEDDYDYFEAFQAPNEEDGFARVGKKNKVVDRFYLLNRWKGGQDAGVFAKRVSPWHIEIWSMEPAARARKLREWELAIFSEAVSSVCAKAKLYDESQGLLRAAQSQKDNVVIQAKRIVACTTTAAALYTDQLQSAAPGIILVEEAGEILESHILTAMTPSTKQLILIGDHQQLRPKVNNYNLTVEKGDGYDLNRSLFERLVLSDYPHTTLKQQHRMCPEISDLVRHLTYPELVDAPSTKNRDALRGLLKRVVFIKHEKQELNTQIVDRRDQGAANSKQNLYEAELTKKVVRYMAQQGYGTADQVVLTPYLGQLGLLRRELAEDNDPILNDMDSFDLVRSGLMSAASASQCKRPLHLSTIDNYQGEERDVVVVSLTRSNPNGDIGFMISPERLNVLLSRARKALIIIGNPATFTASRKGSELWTKLLGKLAENNCILDGLPVRCEQHPDIQMLLETPDDFDRFCPDGGCSAPCGVTLSCGLHQCTQKCHRQADHTKMKCSHVVQEQCPHGHTLTRTCSDGHPPSCHICDAEAAAKAAQQRRALELAAQREANQRLYAAQLAIVQDEIDRIRQIAKDEREREEQNSTLQQRYKDLENAKALAARRDEAKQQAAQNPTKPGPSDPVATTPPVPATAQDSEAGQEWKRQKALEGARNPALDSLMDMIGLEDVKEHFLEIKSKIDLLVRQGLSIEKERFGAALLGNPGTGKTTVARIYAKFLCLVGALPGDDFVESTGAKLASEGVQGCKKMLDDLLNKGGGAFFIDEAYQLASGASFGGGAVLDWLLPEVENSTGKVVFILAGYNKQMEKFFQHNPGLPSRFPRTLQFADYEDDELLQIMNYNLRKRYDGRMKLEDGADGLYARIVARRIGRGRGKEGFGNAREVENIVSKVGSRQAKRLRRQRASLHKGDSLPDDMLFTKEDLIGPEPSNALSGNKAWNKLLQLTGLKMVKDSVQALLDSIQYNYQRELAEEPLVEFSLNKVFVGNPGTGKTTVAKLYGQILADIGMLSSGEAVVLKKPADFIGAALGVSEANTKGILDAAVGKVLVIDEAYGLYGGGSIGDPYRTAVIDTIVAEVQNVPGDDRCVLLLGYKEQMEEMMQNANPGLARRFPIDSGFIFEDFDDQDLTCIFDAKVKAKAFKVTERAREVALEILKRARNRPHFGNAGEIDILLNDAQLRQQKRIAKDKSAAKSIFEAQDFDPEFDRSDRAVTNIAMLFKDTVGCENVVEQLQGYQNVAAKMKQLGQDPREQIPFSFLFRGPPGTGKTTTAQRMGKVYYDMGFLASAEVVNCSASDLVGQYVGQTGPKTRKLLESALGKVLFIDEAYRLAGGHFAQEAMDELVDLMTKEAYFQKLIIILAGYDADINRLMSMNPGLTSRFPEAVVFTPLKPADCLALLIKALTKKKGLDVSVLTEIQPGFRDEILARFDTLASLANFANARDVQTLSKTIYGAILKSADPSSKAMAVAPEQVRKAMNDMVDERMQRENDSAAKAGAVNAAGSPNVPNPVQQLQAPDRRSQTSVQTRSQTKRAQQNQLQSDQKRTKPEAAPSDVREGSGSLPHVSPALAQRDVGVKDEVWAQLQLDRLKAEQEAAELQRLRDEERKLREWLKACADAKRQKELEELERKRKEAEEREHRRQKAQEALARSGRCPVGYQWIKQSGGYRCAGGSHWLEDAQVDAMM
ncbi:uncharacterized protein MYCFIDRAFT_139817 [Pseudocercospora fijiensis CIRAD86]|uniref:AAA+ ATPase domain-containing protein n=1 Tax=Pseudocercospora fijiensis (strain CIRAD86) TaxID=383855 RepID=M3AV62_PSEFD|nr:uncharacterized protein MYCFIDRAFT_139817 [Pseudocercospora fijiensis CIRAD86]EME81372.1 hypothetical protein MYCFIDRAFT_139817 [Pseudocercospora fijiensis CIRAD86]